MNNWLKKNSIHLGIIAFFVIICFAYFSPVLQGKAPSQGDVLQAQAMQKEIMDVKERDGKGPLWTNQMFGGMPTFQIWVQYPYNIATYGIDIVKKALPDPVGTVLLYLLGAYLLFCVLKINPWLAAGGSIAFAFSSYNFIIISAGHSNQALAIGFFAPIIAGILLTLRGKYWLGASLTAVFMALEIRANHVQMTYYLFIAIGILAIIELYHAYKAGTLKTFAKTIAFVGGGMLLAVLVNAGTLWTTYEYAEETIRGKSNLTTDKAEPRNGLDKTYAYEWSQGTGETFTILVPNLYGGASSIDDIVKPTSNLYKTLEPITQENTQQAIASIAQNLNNNQYWGDKPFTAGPFYFGAIIIFLFVFGLFVVKHRWKWWIVSASVLLLLLSFGRHFPLVSDFFFNYVPMYNKFRAVESILAVVGLLVPLLAIMAIKEAQEGKYDQQYLVKKLLWAGGITGGLALLFAIMPSAFFSFKNSTHPQLIQALTESLKDGALANKIADALVSDRIELAKTDALRTFLFILIGFGITWAFITKKMNATVAFGLLTVAILIDMWQIDRRYLNNNNFVSKSELARHYEPRDVDTFILADKDPNFRVFDLSLGKDPFKNADASYFHKTVGGFHSARLKRFQELVDHQLTKSVNQDVLDMLNTKYIVTQDPKTGSYKMQRNPTVCGNAWFVQGAQFVKNADEEMKAISSFDAKKEVIVDERFKSMIDTKKLGVGEEGFIKLVKYHPDHLVYEYSIAKEALAVFSEIYYEKGWKMFIDGKEHPYFRADYVLRAAQLEAGNHKVEFKFEPVSYYAGEKLSMVGSLLLLAGLGYAFYSERKKKAKA